MGRAGMVLVLAACRRDDAGSTGGTGDTGTPIFGSDHGSVVLTSWLPSGAEPDPAVTLEALFIEAPLPYFNLAQCVISSRGFCAPTLPAFDDEAVPTFSSDAKLLDALVTRDLGRKITLGERKASYVFDSSSELGYYFQQWAETSLGSGPLGLEFSEGEWGRYAGTRDVEVPTPIAVLSPDPIPVHDFFDNAPIELNWVIEPDAIGDVYLYYDTPTEDRLIRVPDTGTYALDLSALGLQDGETIDLVLGRWTTGTVAHNGNVAELLVQSNQPIRGSWRSIRTPLVDVFDACADAQIAPSTPPGNYSGTLDGAVGDLDPGPGGCTGFPAQGIDRIIPIDLEDQDLLEVDYQLVADDASVYLLADCTTAASCLVGADSAGVGETESFEYLNDTGVAQRVYVVLDAYDDVTDGFNLDLRISSLAREVLQATCVEAIEQGPIGPGSYHGTLAGNPDNLEPACATDAVGGEGIAHILLGPGATLTATVDVPLGDPKVYLLTNCAISDSCFLYADADTTTTEQIVYVNPTPFSQNLYLVLDSAVNLGEYFLELDF